MTGKAPHLERMDDEEERYAWIAKASRGLARVHDAITPFDSRLRRRVAAFASARDGCRILDVGTGTGKQAFAFGAKGYDVVGIDLSGDMLRIASRKNRHPNVMFQAARATDLPFQDEAFDVSTVSFALHDMPRYIREKAVREMVRVTRPGGTIVVVDYGLPRNRVGRFLVYNLVRLWEKFFPELIASDLEAWLRQSGIRVEETSAVLLGAARILKGTRIGDGRTEALEQAAGASRSHGMPPAPSAA